MLDLDSPDGKIHYMISEKYAYRYCAEDINKIENYDKAMADNTQIWDCHHRAEILPCGRYSINQLKEHGLYFNRPSSELVFIPHSEHYSMHLRGNAYTKGKPLSDEHKKKLSAKLKGRKLEPLSAQHKQKISLAKKGKKLGQWTLEHRRKLSEALKGHEVSEETRKKLSYSRSKANVGRVWTTDGKVNKFVYPEEIPEGWRLGRALQALV